MTRDPNPTAFQSVGGVKLFVCCWILALLLGGSAAAAESVSGRLTVVWGDAARGYNGPADPQLFLHDDTGQSILLFADASAKQTPGDLLALAGRRVVVMGDWQESMPAFPDAAAFRFTAIRSEDKAGPAPLDVTGSQPWVSILLKFSDIAAEPNSLTYFKNMYGNSYPALDHFWRENSGELINVNGSNAFGWYTLPHPRSYYIVDGEADLGALFNDGTAVADPFVDYRNYVGINLMFNDLLDCCAWGGGWWTTLDGESRVWRVTWEPPWGYQNISVIGHETGHGFGLPHSSGQYGQTYDNDWDVMSNAWLCTITDPTFGCVGQHTILYHKDMLGWVAADRKATVAAGQQRTLTLERNAQPSTTNLRLIRLPINGSSSHFLTVEARRRIGYDLQLPGEAVIIHDVDTSRANQANVIDIDGDGDTGDAGAMWVPGETYAYAPGNITVAVNASTSTGWIVTVRNQPPTIPNGDVNGDGLVNSADLATLQNVAVGNFAAGAYPCTLPDMGDFDGNDVLNSLDCLALAALFSGN